MSKQCIERRRDSCEHEVLPRNCSEVLGRGSMITPLARGRRLLKGNDSAEVRGGSAPSTLHYRQNQQFVFDRTLKKVPSDAVVAPVRPRGPRQTSRSNPGLGPAADEHGWWRRARNFALRACIGVATLLALSMIAQLGRADDQLVPIQLEAQLFAKVLAYDRNFPDRAGQMARVLLVAKKDHADSVRVASQMQSALSSLAQIGGVPHEEIVVTFGGAAALANLVRASAAAAVFFGPGFDDDVVAIKQALDGHDVLTAGSVPEYVPHGIVLGFDIVSGSPKLLVHLTQAKRQHVALRAELLRMARIFE
jgi:hypothetical protein